MPAKPSHAMSDYHIDGPIHCYNIHDESVHLPLPPATWGGYTGTMRVLLELGAAVDAESHGGTTPLHLCSANDDVKSLKFLLTSGAKVNTKNKDGMTALYLAAFYGANRAITILLDSGAFPDEQV